MKFTLIFTSTLLYFPSRGLFLFQILYFSSSEISEMWWFYFSAKNIFLSSPPKKIFIFTSWGIVIMAVLTWGIWKLAFFVGCLFV
jgi:hypothetical protein